LIEALEVQAKKIEMEKLRVKPMKDHLFYFTSNRQSESEIKLKVKLRHEKRKWWISQILSTKKKANSKGETFDCYSLIRGFIRYTIEYESLVKVEAEQRVLIDKLSNSES
jgi:hypothetical protein